MEIEARGRVEQLKREQREMQRRLRDEEMDVRARIAGLETPAQTLSPSQVETPVETVRAVEAPGPVETPSAVQAPVLEVTPVAEPAVPEAPIDEQMEMEDFDDYSEAKTSIRVRMSEETDDPDVLKALKAFRRRT
jgi:hypothetical protein